MKWNAMWLAFIAATLSFVLFAQIQPNPPPLSFVPPLYADPFQHAFKHIQHLRKENQLDEALSFIQSHLKTYPNDVDVTLLKGFILYQKKQFEQAAIIFQAVLEKQPTYIDAQVGLVSVEIAQNRFKKADVLLQTFLQSAPKNQALLNLNARLKRIMTAQKKAKAPRAAAKPVSTPTDRAIRSAELAAEKNDSTVAKAILRLALQKDPGNDRLCIALADQYLVVHQDLAALSTITNCLKINPNSAMLNKKLGEIFIILIEYPQAALAYQQALRIMPGDKVAQVALTDIRRLTPYYTHGLNEIGIHSDNAYVSDLHSVWDYTTLFFNRNISFGRLGGRVNYASRLGQNAPQFQIDFSPRYNRNLYFDFSTAFANKPELFPNWMTYGEAFYNVPDFFEFSVGLRQSSIGPTYFTSYTASVNKYTEHFFFSFRPYYFVPKDRETTLLYTGVIRRYFDTLDHFINVNFGAGMSPDLSDLLTVNFIKIHNYFAFLNYEFPIMHHQFIIDVGAGYQLWQYPNGLNRNLYNGLLGLKYRFG